MIRILVGDARQRLAEPPPRARRLNVVTARIRPTGNEATPAVTMVSTIVGTR